MTEESPEVVTDPRYQTLPAMQAPDYRRLKESFARRFWSVLPMFVDENGRILDGHHRAKVWAELGYDPSQMPVHVMEGLTEAEKKDFIWAMNVPRRHLTTLEKREQIREFLIEHPELSNRQIAADVGVSDVTVGSVRRELEGSAQIEQTIRPHQRTDQGVSRDLDDPEEGHVEDGADHRRMCWVQITIGYSLESDRERDRGPFPYVKQGERREWTTSRMAVTAPSPASLMELGALLSEGMRSAMVEARDRPLLSMLAGREV